MAPAAEPQPLAAIAGQTPELSFAVTGASAERHTAVPTVSFALRVSRLDGPPVRSIVLDTQIQIAARQRSYEQREREQLRELFDTPQRWGTTLRTLLWTRLTVTVPPFEDSGEVALQVPCSYDLEASDANFLSALEGGEVPLEFLFSGSIFYTGPNGMLQTTRISWEREAEYRMPVSVWREAMDRHFPGAAWLRVGRPAFERLRAYKSEHGLRTLDEAVERLLDADGQR